MIVIVDYGVGNLISVKRMLDKNGTECQVSGDPEDIYRADKIILPGVGSFDYGMGQLEISGLIEALNEHAISKKKPILGICLGLQMLFSDSEEGKKKGLGWIKGSVISFNKENLPNALKIPHMGWSDIQVQKPSRLIQGLENDARFYFVHSYHLSGVSEKDSLVTTTYGYNYVCGIEHDNILGVQFHPEKSHKYGMKLLENFAKRY